MFLKRFLKKTTIYMLTLSMLMATPGCSVGVGTKVSKDEDDDGRKDRDKDRDKDKDTDKDAEKDPLGDKDGEGQDYGKENDGASDTSGAKKDPSEEEDEEEPFVRVVQEFPETTAEYKKLGENVELPTEGALTREEFLCMLVKEFGYTIVEGYCPPYSDIRSDRWSVPYLAAAQMNAVLRENAGSFSPEEEMDRGTAYVWVMNALGVQVETTKTYKDLRTEEEKEMLPMAAELGLASMPYDQMFHPGLAIMVSEAKELIENAKAMDPRKRELRQDAANNVELTEAVKVIQAEAEKNIPVYMGNAEEPRITFAAPDEAMLAMTEGDILFIPPCKTMPQGFFGKITEVTKTEGQISFLVAEPELHEVVTKLDISARYRITDVNAVDGKYIVPDEEKKDASGYLDNIKDRVDEQTPDHLKNPDDEKKDDEPDDADKKENPKDEEKSDDKEKSDDDVKDDSGKDDNEPDDEKKDDKKDDKKDSTEVSDDPYFDYYAGEYLNYYNGHVIWSAFGGVGAGDTITIETKSFKEKKGAYGQAVLTLDVAADLFIGGDGLEITDFDVYTNIHSEIELTAGYHLSGEIKGENPIGMNYAIPIAGPFSLMITPKLYTEANGDFKVEAYAHITNDVGMSFSMYRDEGEDMLQTWQTPTMDARFTAEAEGKVKIGPELKAKIAFLGTSFFDGMDVVDITAFAGVSVDGSFAVKQEFSVDETGKTTYSGHQNTPDENGNLHTCYLCAGGEVKLVADGSIGIGEELQKTIKKLVGDKVKLSYKTKPFEHHLFYWHYSTGPDYEIEFEPRKCPHIAYPIKIKAVDSTNQRPIEGVDVKVNAAEKVFTKLEFPIFSAVKTGTVSLSDFKPVETEKQRVNVKLDDGVTDANGEILYYLEYGQYSFDLSKEGYTPDERSITFWAQEKGAREYVLEFAKKPHPIVKSGPMFVYKKQLYAKGSYPEHGIEYMKIDSPMFGQIAEMLVYKGKIYYTSKTPGTSEYDVALSVCDMDGSNSKVITYHKIEYVNGKYVEPDWQHKLTLNFMIDNDRLYYYVSTPKINEAMPYYDLKEETFKVAGGQEYEEIVAEFGTNRYVRYDKVNGYFIEHPKRGNYKICRTGSSEPIYETPNMIGYLYLIENNKIYFDMYYQNDGTIADYNGTVNSFCSYDMVTGELTKIDSRRDAGGGGFFGY